MLACCLEGHEPSIMPVVVLGRCGVRWAGVRGMPQGAGRDAGPGGWQISPLPEARARLAIDRSYSTEEFGWIARGFVPASTDDRWLICFDGDWLAIHHSWSGHCIYRVRFAREGDRHRMVEAWANRDPAQYRRADDAADASDLLRLIEILLLGRPYLVPE